jgi:hypothetical protein
MFDVHRHFLIAKQPEVTVTYLRFIVSVVRNKWLGLDKNAIA